MCAQILVLLEEHENSRQVIESLRLSGHSVFASKNFNEAIGVLKGQPIGLIDLIISDVHLQNGGSVFDFLKWVKKNPATCDVPFVLYSARPSPVAKVVEDGLRTCARLLGAALYITMEVFDSAQFREQIESFLPMEQPMKQLSAKGK